MLFRAEMRKWDAGYRAVVVRCESGLIPEGEMIQNRNFKSFKPGTLIDVQFNLSKKGRRIVKSATYTTEEGILPVDSKPEPVNHQVESKPLSAYYISAESRLNLNTAYQMSKARPERAVKVMMVGASGYGKTTLPRLFAERIGKKFMRMNCATVRDPEEWFGFREAVDGSTVFIRSQFSKLIEEGNAVIVLDEFNRLEPWLHNTLFPLLDDDGATVVHDESFHIGSGVIVIGTINTGHKYTGIFELDEALLNRFQFIIEVGAMPEEEEIRVLTTNTGVSETEAKSITKLCNILRQNEVACSTRTSLLVANMVRSGMTIREAFESSVVKRIPVDAGGLGQRKKVVDLVNAQIGNFSARRFIEEDIFGTGEVEQPRQSAKLKSYHLSLSTIDAEDLLFIKLITVVRCFSILSESGEEVYLDLANARDVVNKIRDGATVKFDLARKPNGLDSLMNELRRCGVQGKFVEKTSE